MKFSVRHNTTYTYTHPVTDSINDVHLCPVCDALQRCEAFELSITPTQPKLLRRLDFYTNQVHHFEVTPPHQRLEVVARSIVRTFSDERDFDVLSDPRALAGLPLREQYYDFLHASERVPLMPILGHEASGAIEGVDDVQRQVERIMRFIVERFTYAAGTTRVDSSVEEVFARRKGVCQDFAHIMIGMCRSVGIPARYVSGYFYVAGKSDRPEDDNSVSHAWVECYLPAIGWVGYDPTHNRRVGEIYIKVAVGRDYADVRPLAGTFRGKSDAVLEVSVQVERID